VPKVEVEVNLRAADLEILVAYHCQAIPQRSIGRIYHPMIRVSQHSVGLVLITFMMNCTLTKINLDGLENVLQTSIGSDRVLLSLENLHQLPDESQHRLDTLLAIQRSGQENPVDEQGIETIGTGTPDINDREQKVDSHKRGLILAVSDIPTIRSMYRTRRLLQRDQGFAPNDTYNQTISFCYHDLTKLKVDAVINSANRAMKVTSGDTLNNAIHRAAGPKLIEETQSKGKIEPGEAILTSGHNLPSTHIIHIARPAFTNAKEPRQVNQFNQLADCYRISLKKADEHELKSIAFPCLGTGNLGIPPKVAARVALQELRESLDAHPEFRFERIIICVNTAADEQAYLDFFPVFFPPTHGDLDVARSSVWSEDRVALAKKVLDTRSQVQKILAEVNNRFSITVPDFPQNVLGELASIDAGLASIRKFLLWSELLRNMQDLKLILAVVHEFCGSLTEIVELAKDAGNPRGRTDDAIWSDFVADMGRRHGTDPSHFLEDCRKFVEGLDEVITENKVPSVAMLGQRPRLEKYKAKQRDQSSGTLQGRLNALDEVLYIREFQRDIVDTRISRKLVKIHDIHPISQLYKLDELDEQTTLAHPSATFNNTVCLVRNDITLLEVDIMVNSTDVSFAGMGTLDRSIFTKGGPEMEQAVKAFGVRTIGDVVTTAGYALPAQHVLHVIPPDQYGKKSKQVIRNIYREILWKAVEMRATSIAIPSIGTSSSVYLENALLGFAATTLPANPCIFSYEYRLLADDNTGTGRLNYPRRDCVSLALEEVKRFLETAEANSLPKKIIFVVYSSNDEFIYKSLMPVYFPPIDLNVNRALPTSSYTEGADASITLGSSDVPRRTVFKTIGDAFRSVRLGKQPETSRAINANEEHALIGFESHAKDCDVCKDPKRLYLEGRDLCEHGYNLAQLVLWHMDMVSDQSVRTKIDVKGQNAKLEVPNETFPVSLSMLSTVEKSYRDGERSRPFVSPNRLYKEIVHDQAPEAISPADDNVEPDPKKARAHVLRWSKLANDWAAVYPNECHIRVYPIRVEIRESAEAIEDTMPLLTLMLDTSETKVERHKTTPEVILTGARRIQLESTLTTDGALLFRCRSNAECNSLLRMLRRIVDRTRDPLWNPRLKEIRDELVTVKKASGGLSDLQFKMERLSTATSDISSAPSEQKQAVSEPYHTSRSPLATRILICLLADLKTRPGSYVGLDTASIVSALHNTPEDISAALKELVAEDQIHNTLDSNTWSLSHPPAELPVIATDPPETNAPTPTATTPTPEPLLSDLAISIFSAYDAFSGTVADLIREISPIEGATHLEVERAVAELGAKVNYYAGDNEPPGPLLPRGIVILRHDDPDWTRIDRRLVHPGALGHLGIPYNADAGSVMITRKLYKDELVGLVSITRSLQAVSEPVVDLPADSPLQEKILAYLKLFTLGTTIHFVKIATVFKRQPDDVIEALEALESQGKAHAFSMNRELWMLPVEDKQQLEAKLSSPGPTQVRDASTFRDTPPSPILPPANLTPLSEETSSQTSLATQASTPVTTNINTSSHLRVPSPSGAHWTRLSKRIISPQILRAAYEAFHEEGEYLIVHRVLRRGEIRKWTEATRLSRRNVEATGEGEGKVTTAEGGGKGAAGEGEGKETGEGVAKERDRETREEQSKGRERERDNKDAQQQDLDRVLAGDIPEEQLRRFRDGEERRG
jgi:O-acetyl-ADP-ribose deacetylase (regulator of RNase III)